MSPQDMALIEAMRTGNTGMLRYLNVPGERSAADRMAAELNVNPESGEPNPAPEKGDVEIVFGANSHCCPSCSALDGSTVMTVPEDEASIYVGKTPPFSHPNCKCHLVLKSAWTPSGMGGFGPAMADDGSSQTEMGI